MNVIQVVGCPVLLNIFILKSLHPGGPIGPQVVQGGFLRILKNRVLSDLYLLITIYPVDIIYYNT